MGIEIFGTVLTFFWVGFLLLKHPNRKIVIVPYLFLIFVLSILLLFHKGQKSESVASVLFVNLAILLIYFYFITFHEK